MLLGRPFAPELAWQLSTRHCLEVAGSGRTMNRRGSRTGRGRKLEQELIVSFVIDLTEPRIAKFYRAAEDSRHIQTQRMRPTTIATQLNPIGTT
jgi:hypothetical protein